MSRILHLVTLSLLLGFFSCQSQKTERQLEDEFVQKYAPENLDTHGFTLAVDSKVPEVHQLFNDLEANFFFYGDKKEFEKKAERIIELDPNYPSGILMKSFYVTDTTEYKNMVTKAYLLSKKTTLKSEQYILQAEYSLLVEDDYKKAQKYFQKVVDLYPKSPTAIWSLGMAYYYNKEYDKALECYRKSTEFIPHLPKGYEFMAAVYYRKKNYRKAIEYIEKAKKYGAKPQNDIYFAEFESFIYYRNKQFKKAMEYVEKVREYGEIFKNSKDLDRAYNLSKAKLDSIKLSKS